MECRQPVRLGRPANESHAGFFRRASALPVIASEARGNDIVPALLSSECDRDDMVECQILGRKLFAAILTRVVISRINIGTGKLHAVVTLHTDIFQQADYG